MGKINKLKELILNNRFSILIFILATIFFLYQHYKLLSWDFSAYVLNARYLFYGGNYFETVRPPVVPIFLGFFLIFGSFGEYLYIIFVSAIFFYSVIKLSDVVFDKWILDKSINKTFVRFIFYFFSLGSFTLIFGLSAGSELLALSFFMLFLCYFLKDKISGHFLALAFLTRYAFLIFIPLLFINKNYRKIIKNIGIFLVVVFPWLLFNYIKFGNWFTSIIDSYANNIYLRQYLFQQFNFLQIFAVIGWFLPFFVVGIILALVRLLKKRENWFHKNKFYLLFFLLIFLVIYDYSNIPLKQIRYLFDLILPVAFFSSLSVLFLISKVKRKEMFEKISPIVLIIIFIFSLFTLVIPFNGLEKDLDDFSKATDSIKELGIENCSILSNNWVPVTYFTGNVNALGGNSISGALNEGEVVLIFYNHLTIDDGFSLSEIKKYNQLYETKEYIFLAKENLSAENCKKKYVFDGTYVTNHCEIISKKFINLNLNNTVLSICEKINRKK